MNETSGLLRAAVEKYLGGAELDADELAIMRAYLKQWLAGFAGAEIAYFRLHVARISSTRQLQNAIADLVEAGIDPL